MALRWDRCRLFDFDRDDFLRTIQLPANFCTFKSTASCNGLMKYRTVSGVCNNLARPYEGSSQTAFARLLPAAYDDGKKSGSVRIASLRSWWFCVLRFVCTSFTIRVGWSFASLSRDQFSDGFWARLWSILQQHVCHLWTISHSRYYIRHTSHWFRPHTDHLVFLQFSRSQHVHSDRDFSQWSNDGWTTMYVDSGDRRGFLRSNLCLGGERSAEQQFPLHWLIGHLRKHQDNCWRSTYAFAWSSEIFEASLVKIRPTSRPTWRQIMSRFHNHPEMLCWWRFSFDGKHSSLGHPNTMGPCAQQFRQRNAEDPSRMAKWWWDSLRRNKEDLIRSPSTLRLWELGADSDRWISNTTVLGWRSIRQHSIWPECNDLIIGIQRDRFLFI